MNDLLADIKFQVAPDILWGILALVLAGFLIVSAALNYHWKYYGIENNPKIFAKSFFWVVSFGLILIMTTALVAYESAI